jgi:hypothetical protein
MYSYDPLTKTLYNVSCLPASDMYTTHTVDLFLENKRVSSALLAYLKKSNFSEYAIYYSKFIEKPIPVEFLWREKNLYISGKLFLLSIALFTCASLYRIA